MPPQVIHGIQFGCSPRQETQLQPQSFGMLATAACGMRRSAIFKEHDMPATPMRADHGQEGLMGGLIPHIRNQGYPLKAGQLEYDCRYSTMHGMPVTGGRGFRALKPLWYNGVPP